MSKKDKSSEASASQDSHSKIEAIKNLIFGENIQEIDTEFDTLKKAVDKQKQHLENYIEEVRNELMQSIDSLNTDVNIRITDLEDSLNNKTEALTNDKVDREQLGQLLVNLGEKIRS